MWWNYFPKFKDQKVKDVFLFEERLDGGLRQGPAKCQCNQSEVTNIKYWCTSIVNHFSKKTVFEETKIFLRSAIQNLVCKKSYYNCQTKSDKVAVCPLKILTWTMYTLCMVLKSQYCGNWLINYAGCQNVAAKLCICIQ